jgi:hypothetical protein
VRVFDWYVRKNLIPPKREEVRRDPRGMLEVDEPLLAMRFEGRDLEEIREALQIMVDRHSKYGGPLASSQGETPPPAGVVAPPRRRRGLDSETLPSRTRKRGRP